MKQYVVIRQRLIERKPNTLQDLEVLLEGPATLTSSIPACPWAAGVYEVESNGNLKLILHDFDTSD